MRDGKLVGANRTKSRLIGTGRLRGFTATDTSVAGGSQSAQALFRTLTGRAAGGASDRAVLDNGLEVLFRASGRSGHPKIEIVNPAAKTLEKISFLP